MADDIIDPKENGPSAAIHNQSVIARGETQLEAGAMVNDLRPDHHVTDARSRPRNGDLDKFRHLFGPKRRGR